MWISRQKTLRRKLIPIKPRSKCKRGPAEWVVNHILAIQSIISLGLAISLSFLWIFSGSAQGIPAAIWQMRVIEAEKTGLQNPAGLAFSSRANAFHVMEEPGQSPPVAADITRLTSSGKRAASTRIAAQIKDPINIAFDSKAHRLLILQFPANQLLEVQEKPDGNLDPTSLVRHAASRFGLKNPKGLAVDPTSGTLFILDAAQPRILRIEPGPNGSFDTATFSEVNLKASGLTSLRGLAFDPATGHLYLTSPTQQKLYELTQTGQVVADRDLSGFGIRNPQGMVIAPSGDQTDDPSMVSLYLADSGQVVGQILELSLIQPVPAAASPFTSVLVRTTDLSAISPPSPDPDGLTYLPQTNRLFMSDSEVEETVSGITHFTGANLWELTLSGSVTRTANISYVTPTLVPMTNEPTGTAWSPANGHFFISDDNSCKVYDLNPGADGLVGTADDTWTNFSTTVGGTCDTEGITYDTWNNRLFVVDGTNREIYQYTTSGSLVSNFDVAAYGVADPESVEFNPDSGTLFVLSNSSNRVIVETTLSGTLLQTINVSANSARAPAGLAYAPSSDGSGAKHFYIVDRGIDNNTDPNIVDGKMYEMSAPASTPAIPVVTDIPNQTIAEGSTFTTIYLDDYVSDADNTDAQMTWTYSGNTALNVNIVARVATITIPNVDWNGAETLTFRATDPGGLWGQDAATFTVTAVNDAPVVSGIPDQTISEGGTFATINLDNYVSDVDNTDAQMTWTYSGNTQLGVSITSRVATVTIPNVDWNGAETITFRATDPGGLWGQDAATFTVTGVNDAPVVSGIPDQTIAEGGTFTTIHLDDYVSDVDNTDVQMTWTYSGNTQLGISIISRVATITIPNMDWNGAETITFWATDPGGLWAQDVAVFTVTGVNDAPVVADIPDQTIDEGSTFTTINLDDYVSDVDNTDAEITWNYFGNINLGVSIVARVATISTPNVDWNGAETIAFIAIDPDGLEGGDQAIFTVKPINDLPTISDIPDISTNENISTGSIPFTVGDVETPAALLTVTATSSNTSLVPNENISLGGSDENRTIDITPAPNMSGTTTITITVDDGTATASDIFQLTVTAKYGPHTIKGNAGVADASIVYTDGATTADSNGAYSLTVPYGWTGTVTPFKTGYTFSPHSYSYTDVQADLVHQDFTAEWIPPTFGDVPYEYSVTYGGVVYPLHDHIQALFDAGYTAGCNADPLSYCPNNTLTRVEAAVFMLRGLQGTSYSPPTDPAGYVFTDDWSSPTVSWGQSWAEGMWNEGLTAGCSTDPLLFCPATTFTRAEAGVFGLRIENGAGYTPPAATHIFADDWSNPAISWAEAWAEQAYLHGLLPACGESGGKPLFCPGDLVTRAWAAYLVVEAKDLMVGP